MEEPQYKSTPEVPTTSPIGTYVRQQRTNADLSIRALAKRVGIPNSTIFRIESGVIANPSPDLLRRIAESLDLATADIFQVAGYQHPNELPSLRPYLRSKYGELPERAIAKVEEFINRQAAKHGGLGPVDREDER